MGIFPFAGMYCNRLLERTIIESFSLCQFSLLNYAKNKKEKMQKLREREWEEKKEMTKERNLWDWNFDVG